MIISRCMSVSDIYNLLMRCDYFRKLHHHAVFVHVIRFGQNIIIITESYNSNIILKT